jgi:hypothetical protein
VPSVVFFRIARALPVYTIRKNGLEATIKEVRENLPPQCGVEDFDAVLAAVIRARFEIRERTAP